MHTRESDLGQDSGLGLGRCFRCGFVFSACRHEVAGGLGGDSRPGGKIPPCPARELYLKVPSSIPGPPVENYPICTQFRTWCSDPDRVDGLFRN